MARESGFRFYLSFRDYRLMVIPHGQWRASTQCRVELDAESIRDLMLEQLAESHVYVYVGMPKTTVKRGCDCQRRGRVQWCI